MSDLRETLVGLARRLDQEGIRYMVIGGIANLEWGEPRTTLDIDITILASDDALVDLSREIGVSLVDDASDFVAQSRVLPVRLHDGTRLDLIAATMPYEEAAIGRVRTVAVDGYPVAFCSPEDLIVHKIISSRARDLEDVEGVMRRQRGMLDLRYLDMTVEAFSRALDEPEIIERYEAAKRLAEG